MPPPSERPGGAPQDSPSNLQEQLARAASGGSCKTYLLSISRRIVASTLLPPETSICRTHSESDGLSFGSRSESWQSRLESRSHACGSWKTITRNRPQKSAGPSRMLSALPNGESGQQLPRRRLPSHVVDPDRRGMCLCRPVVAGDDLSS